ncbi:hypothetical protein ACHQM5_001765 [Ranunculus cassubicifolius]
MTNGTENSSNTSQTSTPPQNPYHPALNVTNIKNLIPLQLDPNQYQYGPWAAPWQPYWSYPPSPYPTQSYRGPSPYHNQSQSLLGPAPRPPQRQQALLAPQSGYAPTDLSGLFNGMHIQPPDANWYMDTGASTHLMNNPGSYYGGHFDEMQ